MDLNTVLDTLVITELNNSKISPTSPTSTTPIKSLSESELQSQSIQSLPETNLKTQLKSLSQKERFKLLELLEKEEYEEQQAILIQEQKQKNDNQLNMNTTHSNSCNMSSCKKIDEIIVELYNLRMQIQDLRFNSSFHIQQQQQQKQQHQLQQLQQQQLQQQQLERQIEMQIEDEYEQAKEECSSMFSWLPLWIFIAFILFALTSKPRCSVIGGIGEIGSKCPFPNLSEFCTSL